MLKELRWLPEESKCVVGSQGGGEVVDSKGLMGAEEEKVHLI